jgi:membrane-associated phospholipid phosphatase
MESSVEPLADAVLPASTVLAEESASRPAAVRLSTAAWIVAVVVWAALLAAALGFDRSVATAVHNSGMDDALRASRWTPLWKAPGTFEFTVLVVVVGIATRWLSWRNGLFVFLSGVMAGLNVLPKWAIGRTRPFKLAPFDAAEPFKLQPFCHGIYGFFHQRDLSFPSGHECSAWALAAAIAVLYPRASSIFFALAVAVGIERVMENAHYCSDVVAAVSVATFGCWLACRLVQPTAELGTHQRPV